jgi:hypothetical protein
METMPRRPILFEAASRPLTHLIHRIPPREERAVKHSRRAWCRIEPAGHGRKVHSRAHIISLHTIIHANILGSCMLYTHHSATPRLSKEIHQPVLGPSRKIRASYFSRDRCPKSGLPSLSPPPKVAVIRNGIPCTDTLARAHGMRGCLSLGP